MPDRRPSRTEVEASLMRAIAALRKNDFQLLEGDANERSITHKLAEYLRVEFSDWGDVDCEYNLQGHGCTKTLRLPSKKKTTFDDTRARTVFPDIVVHRRTAPDNLLVIEAKKSTSRIKDSWDYKKLKAFKAEKNYTFAVFLRFYTGGDWQTDPEMEWICE
jgi:hypothetical protein